MFLGSNWSTVNSYASKKQDRDMSRNNKNYGVNNLGDMRNVDDEEYWKRSDDIDAEYASPKKVMKRSGLSENDVMPTKAKLSILVSGYFELPAMRSLRV